MSLLTITQAIATKFGIPLPGSAASSTDLNVIQIVSYINEAGQEIGARHPWQALTFEANFVTVALESQGTLDTIIGAANGFSYVVNDSIWDRTTRRPLFGPRSSQEWQMLKAQFVQGPWYQFRIRGNQVLIQPVPPAGDAIYFEWITKEWATSSDGGTLKEAMTADGDLSRIDDRLIRLDAIWRFKEAKGLDFETDFDKAEAAIIDAMARDGSAPILSLNGLQPSVYPGVIVPAGNWPTA